MVCNFPLFYFPCFPFTSLNTRFFFFFENSKPRREKKSGRVKMYVYFLFTCLNAFCNEKNETNITQMKRNCPFPLLFFLVFVIMNAHVPVPPSTSSFARVILQKMNEFSLLFTECVLIPFVFVFFFSILNYVILVGRIERVDFRSSMRFFQKSYHKIKSVGLVFNN